MPRLLVTEGGDGLETEYRFDGRLTLGRSSDCDVSLDHAGVSRLHASISVADGKVILTDEKSHNGTFLNGSRIEVAEVSAGDAIVVGETSFRFEADAPAEEPVPVATEKPPAPVVEAVVADKAAATSERMAAPVEKARSDRSDSPKRERRQAEETRRSAKGGKSTRRENRSGESTKVRATGGQVLGGARLTANQQLAVKIGSAVFSVLCLLGIVYLGSTMGKKSGGPAPAPIRIDPLDAPRELASDARRLAREAKAVEDAGDGETAYRLLTEAKDKITQACEMMTEISLQHPGEGHKYVEKEAVQLNSQKGAISQQWVRLDIRRAVRGF